MIDWIPLIKVKFYLYIRRLVPVDEGFTMMDLFLLKKVKFYLYNDWLVPVD